MKAEQYWDKSCCGFDRSNEMPHWGGNLIYILLYPIGKIAWRIKVQNLNKLRHYKNRTGVLLISNHTSFLEVYCMYCCVRLKQWVRFVARDTLFKNKLLGKWFSRAGAFPIKRDSADRQALKRAAKMLKNGEIVGIFPEGTRRGKSGITPRLHSGAAFIARMGGNVPIVPMTCRNADKIKQKGQRLRFPKVTVDFGDPILLEDFDFLPKQDRLDAATWYAMRETFAMSKQIKPSEVDMVELFPQDRDFTSVFNEHEIPKHTAQEVAARYPERK